MQALPLRVGSEPEEVAAGDEPDDLLAEAETPSRAATPADGARVRCLVLDHNAFVWRSLVRLGVPRSDAEDALQQVFMVAARRIEDIQHGAERSFLYGVCLRVASRSRRTYARRREVMGEDAAPERVDTSERPDELLDRARAKMLLEEILAGMPIELRSVFTLFELEQLTMSEISELLAIPQGTVASRLRRARELFSEQRHRIEVRMKSQRTLRLAGQGGLAGAPRVADDREAT